MTHQQLIERISRFPRWHYEFDLGGWKTPIFDPAHVNRHRQREAYFFRPMVDLYGGTLAGKRMLDLGCNAGFWSLRALECGCDYVLGIDGRQVHIDQAELVFHTRGIPPSRYDLRCANVLDYLATADEKFDVVLCLGLLYHVNKHMTLLEGISRINTDMLLVDTSLSQQRGSVLEIREESLEDPRNSCESELVMYPTRAAVCKMVRCVGYRCAILKPSFSDYSGAEDFRIGYRRAFVCAKQTALVGLSVEPEDLDDPTSNTCQPADPVGHRK